MTFSYMNFDITQSMPNKCIADNAPTDAAAVLQREAQVGKKPVQYLAAAAFMIVGAAVLVSPSIVRADMERGEQPNATVNEDHRDPQRSTWSLQADQIAKDSRPMRIPADVISGDGIFFDQPYLSDGIE